LNAKLSKILEEQKINEEKIINFKENDEKLSQYEKLIDFKPKLKELELLEKSISENDTKLRNLQKELKEQNEKLEILKKQFTENETNLNNYQQKNQSLKNFYDEAENLENELKLKNENLKLLKQNIDKTNREKFAIQKQIQEYESKISQIKDKLKKNTEWLDNHKEFENLNSDLKLINNLVEVYENSKKQAESVISQSAFAHKFENKDWKDYSKMTEAALNQISEKLNKLESVLKNEDKENLKKQFEKANTLNTTLNKMIILNETYSELKNESTKFEKSIAESTKKKAATEDLQRKTKNETEIIEKKIEELQKRLERENLEAKYENDRLKLSDGSPCPLCGALHHPYASHKNLSQKSDTEIQLTETKNNKKLLDEQIKKYNDELVQLSQILALKAEQLQGNLQKQKKYSEDILQICKQNDLSINCLKIDEVKQFAENNKDSLKEIEEKLRLIDDYQKILSQKQELENIADNINTVKKNRKQLAEILNLYKPYWQNKKNSFPEIAELLENYLSEFNKIKKETDALNTELKSLTEGLSQIKIQIEEKTKNLQSLNQQEQELNTFVDDLNTKLKTIENEHFDGKKRIVFKQNIETKIDELRSISSKLSNNKTSLETSINEKTKLYSSIKEDFLNHQQDGEELKANLTQKLQNIGIESVEKAKSYMLDEAEYQSLKKIKKELEEAKSILIDSKQKLELELKAKKKQDKDERTYEQISINQKEIEDKIEEISKQIGSISQKLQKDEELKKNLKEQFEHLEKLKKEAARWDRLNKIIGDREGNKFSKIAQQFTLNYLISFANKHLSDFTDRYVLDKVGDKRDNLFIYDRDMGMAKRSVQTLSGGETFLVSLSLALALSDLASRNTRLESLFIDEGFATLDEDTLDRALVNLEKLHINTKRTIGLISHVQLIKERISTKIILEKTNSGFSSISII